MKIGVILSGCGVFDGSEIHEAVFTLLAIEELGHEALCFAPNIDQHHVVNHLNGEEQNQKRNVLEESARIARGAISDLKEAKADDLDALVLPGGFGAAKNLSKWAFSGPEGEIDAEVKRVVVEMAMAGKPLGAVCMGPTVIAKALEGTGIEAEVTVGNTTEPSPYEIAAISDGINKTGSKAVMKNRDEVAIDKPNKIVTGPCYMMETDMRTIRKNTYEVVDELVKLA